MYVKRDPTAGAGGCQAYLPCPGSGTPEQLPTSTSAGPATTGEETPEAEAPTTLSGASIYGMTTAFAVAVMSAAWYVL